MENDKINLRPLRHPCLSFIWPRTEEWSATASFFSRCGGRRDSLSSPPSSLVLKSPQLNPPFSITAHPHPQPSGRLPVCFLNAAAAADQCDQSWQGIAPHAGWNISKKMMTIQPQSGLFHLSRILSHGLRAKGPRVRLTDYDSLIGRIPRPEDGARRGHLGSAPLRQHNKGCRSISKAACKPDISFLPGTGDGEIVTLLLVNCLE